MGVVTYSDTDAVDMAEKLPYVVEHFEEVKSGVHLDAGDDNVGRMADWLADESTVTAAQNALAVR